MPAMLRNKTQYPGVYFVIGTCPADGKPEKIFYILYRRNGRLIEEKAGRSRLDDMTAARAANLRAQRMKGKELPNVERREAEKTQREAEANKWTISRLWSAYLENTPELKGIRTDKNRFEKHIKTVFGDREPKDIFPLDVDRLRIQLLKKKSPATTKNVLELLRRIVNFGKKKSLCLGPGFTIQMPEVHNEKTEDLDGDQLARLLKAIDESEYKQAGAMMKLALFTGMRRGEMFKLHWEDIDFDRNFITLRDPKGGRDQKIPLNAEAVKLLKSHPKEKSSFVFPGRKGQQRTDIKKEVNAIKKAAGLPAGFRALHGLRHAYASMLASSGQVDMFTLQKLLTHKSPLMTQRYAHLRDEALKKASNLVGDIISEAMNTQRQAKVVGMEKNEQ